MVFNTSYTLVAETATAADLLEWSGSAWVASGSATSVEDFWAFGDDGSYNVFGGTFDYIVSAVGDIDNGAETLGNADLFISPGSGNQPNGIDYGIVSDDFADLSGNSLNQEPLIQNMLTLTFRGPMGMTMDGITDVQPFFGTDGRAIPEPGTLGLLGAGLLGLAWRRRRAA